MITGRLYDEASVLRVALAYERATKWHTMNPPLDENLKKMKTAAIGGIGRIGVIADKRASPIPVAKTSAISRSSPS